MGKFVLKNLNCLFKMKLSMHRNSNMQNSIGYSLFPFWAKNTHFWNICPQNCLIKMKLGAWANSNMLNLMVMFTYPVLDQIYLFCANLVQNIKVVCLRWNMILRLIWICWRHGDVQSLYFRRDIPLIYHWRNLLQND